MVGAASPDRQQSNCYALGRVLPDVRVARLRGLGHVAHNAEPDQVAAVISSFLEARRRRAAPADSR
jgi:hypothetical protein